MLTAILDTNVIVQAAISPRGASYRTLDAYFDGKFQLVFSEATLQELTQVLLLPNIQARHGWSEPDIGDFVSSLTVDAAIYVGQSPVPATLTRDVTDTKFLSLAADSGAAYLVTNDRRHLLRLRLHVSTRIVSPTQFLAELP
jgi:putative PIN family toxin of toxin-antitoxin system